MTVEIERKPPVSEAVVRARMIRDRQKTSIFWKVVHLLGSLQLALILLSTIALAVAVATFYESSFNAKIAQAYIYKAPWFIFWLGILCINLFAVTLTRWPWQKKHTGFIVTHYGIILLLIGAVIGSQMGFEGNVTLDSTQPPINRITTSRSVIQVESPTDGGMYIKSFDAEVARPSERRPATIPVPGSDLVIVTDAFSEDLVNQKFINPSTATTARTGVDLTFSSAMVGRSMDMPLALRSDGGMEEDFFGLARIAIVPDLPNREAKMIAETQMVFAKFAPLIQSPTGQTTGIAVTLSPDAERITITTPGGTSTTYARESLIGNQITAEAATIFFEKYWPDFVMKDGSPQTKSDQPNNPALQVKVRGPATSNSETTGASPSQPLLEIAPAENPEQVRYQISRNGIAYSQGELAAGESVDLGWSDWKMAVNSILPNAEIVSEARPSATDATGIPGFRAWLRAPDGSEGSKRWIESGTLSKLVIGGSVIQIGYGLELKPVPFSIRLKSFEVPRFEGTETPANFIATVEFQDRASGETLTDVARMNKPASWPGGLAAHITGINYKFSQAEWNPRNLNETTLQVLYDPGWLLKWIGSLAICIGIFIMFYIRPPRANA